ncbi:uncharacterized protein ISCGN_013068 [Ixodes scapularis]
MCSSRPEVPGVGPSDFDPVTFLQASLFVSKLFLLRLRLRTLGLCLRKNITHPAIHQVFGFSSSRWAANYRVMQIARQEVSQEILVMQRSLPCLMTSIFGTNFATHPSYVFLSKSAHLLLESSWKLIISSATAEKRVNQSPALEPPLNLSDTTLSAHAESVLSRGPKFAPAYEPSRIDQPAAVHQVASKIPEPERQDFLATGSRVVCRYGRAPPSKLDFLEVVDELRRSELKLLEADKTGVFVVMTAGDFNNRLGAVLDKNFTKMKSRPSGSLRTEAKTICKANELTFLLNKLSKPSDQYLRVFFTAKTHKQNTPFRGIVSESGCWQRHLALFLQKHLTAVPLDQPFRVGCSLEVLPYLRELHSAGPDVAMFSLDVTDMFYSLDVVVLMDCIEQAVTQSGVAKFQNSTGITLEAFLQLVDVYLRSTLVEHQGNIYRQKSGVCIGSCLAPVLSEFYMSSVDLAVERELGVEAPGTKVFRFVDDYLVLHTAGTTSASIERVFSTHSQGLKFTSEDPSDGELQFLDLRLHTNPNGLCWGFQQRTKKPVLPFGSNHSKTVKSGIVRSLLSSSRTKSCSHFSQTSLTAQICRLRKAGYPRDLLVTSLKSLISQPHPDRARPPRPKKFAVIPYHHSTSHRLRAAARRYDVDVALSCRFRLGSMCRLVNDPQRRSRAGCAKKHKTPFISCATGRVYSIPLSCGAEYIGQTGRCVNDRLGEHDREIKKGDIESQHPFLRHRGACSSCEPRFHNARILGSHRDRYGREIIEAYAMQQASQNISSPSLVLSEREAAYLRPQLAALTRARGALAP